MDFCTVENPFFRFLTVYGRKGSGKAPAEGARESPRGMFFYENLWNISPNPLPREKQPAA